MKPVIVDTDTLSFYFRRHPEVTAKLDKYLNEVGEINISVMTYYEVLNGLYFKDAKGQLARFEDFVAANQVMPLTDKVAKKAAVIYADLRKKGKTVGHHDILIASTAIVHDMKLVSNNTKDFKNIEGLDLDNWAR